MINVIKSVFQGGGKEGDFAWMIDQPHHQSTLFLFNDNEGEFYKHFKGGAHQCSPGGGNAGIRPYQCLPTPRALGIPTGTYERGIHNGGYSTLDNHVVRVMGDAFQQLRTVLNAGRYDAVAFSWSDETKLGGRIFNTAQPVRDYIVDQILLVAKEF